MAPSELIDRLAEWANLPASDVRYICLTAPRRYKVFFIPKRNGEARRIAQPSKELKLLQRIIASRFLKGIPVHAAAHGYVQGRGIKSNALMHAGSDYALKMDFEDFFPRIVPSDLASVLRLHDPALFNDGVIGVISPILFWRPKGAKGLQLCMGAPTSPLISNLVMFEVDRLITDFCEHLGVVYTRYADDLTFSCSHKGVLSRVQEYVHSLVSEMTSPRLRVNVRKTVHMSRAQRRMITGIVATPDGRISVGRDRKRLIRSMIDHHNRGVLGVDDQPKLRGLLAFMEDIEGDAARKMRARLLRPL